MNWERQLIREQIGAGALSKTLAPYEFLAESGVFITQAGHVAAVLQIEPVPFECSDQEQLDSLARRWEAALRVIDPEMRVYQYAMRREVDSTPHREVENRVLQHATEERLRYLHQENGPLYSIDVFLVVVYELRRTGKFRMPEAGMGRIDQVTRTAAHFLTTALISLVDNLNGVARLEILSDQKAFLFMRRLLNYAPEMSDSQILHRAWDLNWQLADSSIECDGPLKVDRYFVRVLTLKEPPQQTYAHLLRELYELPCNAILATEWKPMPPLETNKAIRKMRRHLNHLQTSLTNHLGKNPPKDHEILVDMGKQALIQQLGKALEEIQMNNTYFGEFSLTILLYDEDPAVLRTATAKAANALHPHGAALAEHVGKSALATWLACVPGNQRFNVRRLRISNVNYADLSFLFGPHRGSPRNSHLQDESLAVFTTNQDTVFHFNFHVGQVGHSIITAQTGAGKTYLGKFLFTQTLKHKPYLVVFDITRTFQGLMRELGGSYIELGRKKTLQELTRSAWPPRPRTFHFCMPSCACCWSPMEARS